MRQILSSLEKFWIRSREAREAMDHGAKVLGLVSVMCLKELQKGNNFPKFIMLLPTLNSSVSSVDSSTAMYLPGIHFSLYL